MKRFLAVVVFAAVVSSLSLADSGSWTGWITDAKCAPRVNAECAKKCADAGEKMVFVNSDKTVMQVANPEVLKGHEGHHVTVKGSLDKGTLTISSVEMVKDDATK
ncbi:MAG TPA: hypothetical protein VHN74_09560 [Candidatus Angelobacter sp.]|jgi:hypothetical protein|nr:hypothetical protein [Candidatus Angelobacter sp.]